MSERARAQPWFRDSPRPLPPMTEGEEQWRQEQLGRRTALAVVRPGGFMSIDRDELRKLSERMRVEWAGYCIRIEP